MKQIDFNKMIKDNDLNYQERMEILGMEFIKQIDGNYLIKNSNGVVVNEKEKIKLENNELILKDFSSNKCQEETTKKISKNKKKLKEVEDGNIKETSSTME